MFGIGPGLRPEDPKGTPKHVTTFAGVINSISRLYSQRFDEAMRNSKEDALAMRRDCYIRALLNERKRPTAQRGWYIDCVNPKDKALKKAADRATLALKYLPKFTTFRFSLLEAIWYGRFGTQLTWSVRPVEGQPWTVPINWRPVNGDKIAFDFDMTPAVAVNRVFAKQWSDHIIYSDTLPFLKLTNQQWRRQFVIHSHEVEDADYTDILGAGAIGGTGVRGQIYWAWWLRDECLSWAINFMQKVGTLGLLVFWYTDGNSSAKKAAEDAAARASQDTVLVLPKPAGETKETWGVEAIQPSTSGIQELRDLIADYFEKHIERLIIGQSLSGNDGGGGLGGAGVAALHRDTKFQILAFDSNNLDETLTNDLLRPIVAMNEPDIDPNMLAFKSILPDPAQQEALRNMTAIWEKVTVPTTEVYRISGVRQPEIGEPVIGGPPPINTEEVAEQILQEQKQKVGAQQGHMPTATPEPNAANPAEDGDENGGAGAEEVDPEAMQEVMEVLDGLQTTLGDQSDPIEDLRELFDNLSALLNVSDGQDREGGES